MSKFKEGDLVKVLVGAPNKHVGKMLIVASAVSDAVYFDSETGSFYVLDENLELVKSAEINEGKKERYGFSDTSKPSTRPIFPPGAKPLNEPPAIMERTRCIQVPLEDDKPKFKAGDWIKVVQNVPQGFRNLRGGKFEIMDSGTCASTIKVGHDQIGIQNEYLKLVNKPESTNPLDVQEAGNHYKDMKIQPIEYAMANKLSPCEFSVLKYISRHRNKGKVEDIKKAIHFLKILAKIVYGVEL